MTLSSINGPCEWGQQMLWYRTCGQLMSCINGPTAPGRPEAGWPGPGRVAVAVLCLRRGSHDRAHRQQGSHDRAHLAAGSHDVIPIPTRVHFDSGTFRPLPLLKTSPFESCPSLSLCVCTLQTPVSWSPDQPVRSCREFSDVSENLSGLSRTPPDLRQLVQSVPVVLRLCMPGLTQAQFTKPKQRLHQN